MKIFNYFLFGLVLVSGGIAHIDAMKRQAESDITPLAKKQKITGQNIQSSNSFEGIINSDLSFHAKDQGYYAIIEHELNALRDLLCARNPEVEKILKDNHSIERHFALKIGLSNYTTAIELTSDTQAQQTAPTIYKVLSHKVDYITQKIKLKTPIIKIEIDFFESHGRMANASADFKKECIRITSGNIKLMAWHEGNKHYYQTEGLLDALIAHELGHIFHQHECSTLANEHEADKTGAQCLSSPINMIGHYLIEGLADMLFGLLKKYTDFSEEQRLLIAGTISSALIKKYPDLGSLGDCTTHEQFEQNTFNAVDVALARYQHEEEQYHPDTPMITIIASLIYQELLVRCVQADQLKNGATVNLQPTHPCPCDRKTQILNLIQVLKNKEIV